MRRGGARRAAPLHHQRAGDEVVQLYVRHPGASSRVARHALEGFRRISLQAGEKKTVTFTLTPRQLSRLDAQARRVELAEKVQVFVGGGQPLAAAVKAGRVQQAELLLTGATKTIE